ncbi:hypothetical protein ACGFI9_32300 [Micromonospora sp. NPDC048930]|uniref:hypothetical protein n=1 Tax=Micromonospora sp. NPDC048930 TaxID=3364261 RepID=UPI00372013D4
MYENKRSSDLQWKSVPAGTLPYHLVLDASRPADQWRLSTRTHTEWDFVSSSNDSDRFEPFALLQMEYRLDTDLHGDVKAGSTEQIRLKPIPQAGGFVSVRATGTTDAGFGIKQEIIRAYGLR